MLEVNLTKEIEQRVAKLVAAGKCPACELPIAPGEKTTCGVHNNCYAAQQYAIKTGKTSVRELIESGERLVPKPAGRKPASAYVAKLLGREGEVA